MHQEFVVLVSTVLPAKYRFVLIVNQTAGMLNTRISLFGYSALGMTRAITHANQEKGGLWGR